MTARTKLILMRLIEQNNDRRIEEWAKRKPLRESAEAVRENRCNEPDEWTTTTH